MTPTMEELDEHIDDLIEKLGNAIGARVFKANQINVVAEDRGELTSDFISERGINEAVLEIADNTVAGMYLRLLG
jgi:hypothetical protein